MIYKNSKKTKWSTKKSNKWPPWMTTQFASEYKCERKRIKLIKPQIKNMKSTYCSTPHSCNPSIVIPKAEFPPQFSTQFSTTLLSGVSRLKVSWPVIRSLHRWICNLELGEKNLHVCDISPNGLPGGKPCCLLVISSASVLSKRGTEWQNYFSHNTKKSCTL